MMEAGVPVREISKQTPPTSAGFEGHQRRPLIGCVGEGGGTVKSIANG